MTVRKSELHIWRSMVKNAHIYYKLHQQKIDDQMVQEKANRITQVYRSLEPLLDFTTWCRNGEVVADAIQCCKLTCKYKPAKASDVVTGIARCQRFQITLGTFWETACHLFPPGQMWDKED